MKARWLLPISIAVALAQIGFLYSMIAGRAAILRDGREVTLLVQPIDPRDLLRGDYVTLGYNITSVPAALFENGTEARQGEEVAVFVRLRAGEDGIWQPVAARYGAKPQAAAEEVEVDIRGLARVYRHDTATPVFVRYGIERYYVPEGEGREIEAGLGVREFRMKVAVADDGAAQIKSLHDGDAMLYAEPLY